MIRLASRDLESFPTSGLARKADQIKCDLGRNFVILGTRILNELGLCSAQADIGAAPRAERLGEN